MENKILKTNNYIDKKDLIIFTLIIIIASIIFLLIEFKLDVDKSIYDLGKKEGEIERHNLLLAGLESGVILVNPNNTNSYIASKDYCDSLNEGVL